MHGPGRGVMRDNSSGNDKGCRFCATFRLLFLVGGLLTASALFDVAQAQDSAPAAGEPTAQASQLGEITVTAERFEQQLSKVPITITALTQDQMAALDITTIDDLVKFVPGVSFVRGENNATNISIRGI